MTPTQPNTQDALRRLLDAAFDVLCRIDDRQREETLRSACYEAEKALAASPKNDAAQWAMEAAKELNRTYIIIFSNGDIEDGREVKAAELAAIITKHCPQAKDSARLLKDAERLDWLDAQTEKLNSYWGTTYGWRFEANHNSNRLTLSDNNIPVLSLRAAIDAAMATKEAK